MWTRTDDLQGTGATVAPGRFQDRNRPLFERVDVDLPCVALDLAHGTTACGRVANVSVGGMYLRTPQAPPVGTRLLCALVRGEAPGAEELYASGTVVYRMEDGIGVAFNELTARAFLVISRMIADSGGFVLKELAPRRTGARRRSVRPRRARLRRWAARPPARPAQAA